MSSKTQKKKLGERYIKEIRRRNSTLLLAEWWSIHITKPAFLKPIQKLRGKEIEKILNERGVKLREPRKYRRR